MSEIFVGTSVREGAQFDVYVEARLEVNPDTEALTVDHVHHSGPFTRLALTGTVVHHGAKRLPSTGGRYFSDRMTVSSGQIDLGDLSRTRAYGPTGWDAESVAELRAIWKRWHLNDMRAGCAHQPTESLVYEDSNYGRRVDLVNTPACPVTGYKYGHAWLIEELPTEVIDFIHLHFPDTKED